MSNSTESTVLQTDDLRLRRWRVEDMDSLLRHANDKQLVRGLSDRFPHPYTRMDAENFFAGKVVDLTQPVLAIEIGGEACGSIGIRPGLGERAHSAELGYWLGRRHWGQGLMTRVVALYVPWLRQQRTLYRLQAGVLDINPASARVLLKNGFVEEGVSRNAILKPDGLHDLRVFARVWPP